MWPSSTLICLHYLLSEEVSNKVDMECVLLFADEPHKVPNVNHSPSLLDHLEIHDSDPCTPGWATLS